MADVAFPVRTGHVLPDVVNLRDYLMDRAAADDDEDDFSAGERAATLFAFAAWLSAIIDEDARTEAANQIGEDVFSSPEFREIRVAHLETAAREAADAGSGYLAGVLFTEALRLRLGE